MKDENLPKTSDDVSQSSSFDEKISEKDVNDKISEEVRKYNSIYYFFRNNLKILNLYRMSTCLMSHFGLIVIIY